MAFITDTDYDVQTRQEILAILDNTDLHSKMRAAEKMAEDQIRNYIGGFYDMYSVFNKIGDERDQYIVMITIDSALYHLWSQKAPRKISEFRSQRYQDALDWLKIVAGGGKCSLPPLPGEVFASDIIIQSRPLNNNKY